MFTIFIRYAILISIIASIYRLNKGGFVLSVVSYKCPNCGGDLGFDPESQKLKCEYCFSNFSEQELEVLTTEKSYSEPGEEFIEDGNDATAEKGTTMLYTCPSCGAQIVTDEVTSATLCCYCHNPVVFSKQLSDEFKPSKVIPFKKSKEQALETFLAWRKKKHFLPDDFSSPSQLEKIAGIYIPYWLVDCDTSGYMRATGKKIKSWTSGSYRYTQTDIYAVSRAASMSFDYLPHDASKKADDLVMESIGPYNYDDLETFSFSYLTGFIAEKYDVDKDTIYPTIKSRIERAVETELRNSIHGYTTTAVGGKNVQIHRTRFHYTLMPIWMLTYIYKGQTYMFAMNGQTGKTFGSLPICSKKLNFLFLWVFLITFAVVFFALAYTGGLA